MPQVGQRIGPFVLADRLGCGVGTVLFRAECPYGSRVPREVAMRVANDPTDPASAGRIASEYAVLCRLDDPRIPRVYGYYAGAAAVAMTWVPGVTLADAIQARADGLVKLDPATALDIAIEIAYALRHAHSTFTRAGPQGASAPARRIVHGHLGPQRIRLDPDGKVFVVGFGAVPRGLHPAYTPPEQAAGTFVDPRSDQWALGAMMVELLLGERLYSGCTDPRQAAVEAHVEPWVDAVHQRWPAVGRLLSRMLAPMAADRYAQEGEWLRDLLEAGRTIGGLADRNALASLVRAQLDRLSTVRPPPVREPTWPAQPPLLDETLPPSLDETLQVEPPVRPRTKPAIQPAPALAAVGTASSEETAAPLPSELASPNVDFFRSTSEPPPRLGPEPPSPITTQPLELLAMGIGALVAVLAIAWFLVYFK